MESVTFLDEELGSDAIIGMAHYHILMQNGGEVTFFGYRINKQDEGIFGLVAVGTCYRRTLIHYGAIRRITLVDKPSTLFTTPIAPPEKGGAPANKTPTPEQSALPPVKNPVQDARVQAVNLLLADRASVNYAKLAEMLLSDAKNKLFRRLGEILLDTGVITQAQLAEVLERQKLPINKGKKIDLLLQESGLLDGLALAMHLALKTGLPLLRLDMETIDMAAVKLFTRELAIRFNAIPIRFTDKQQVLLVVANPGEIELQDISFMLGRPVIMAVITEAELAYAMNTWYREETELEPVFARLQEGFLDEPKEDSETFDDIKHNDAPIMRLINQVIIKAIGGQRHSYCAHTRFPGSQLSGGRDAV